MVLGQSAAMAAGLAIHESVSVQKIPYDELRRQLLAAGQILEWHGPKKAPKQSP